MYLTRLPLDTERRDTMHALYAPNILHGAIEDSFPGERERRLWRIDRLSGQTYLMLLSDEQPDLTGVQRQFGYADRPWQTKDYAPLLERIVPGSLWRFRLVCNPTKSEMEGSAGQRGKVKAILKDELQRAWLIAQGGKHGFSVDANGFSIMSSEWLNFKKGKENGREVSMLQVTFEGVLTVTDRDAFVDALKCGIGRGKAYGMGMMTVIRYG